MHTVTTPFGWRFNKAFADQHHHDMQTDTAQAVVGAETVEDCRCCNKIPSHFAAVA